jgi:hypothetical protein
VIILLFSKAGMSSNSQQQQHHAVVGLPTGEKYRRISLPQKQPLMDIYPELVACSYSQFMTQN